MQYKVINLIKLNTTYTLQNRPCHVRKQSQRKERGVTKDSKVMHTRIMN